jgi:hypothetical protein
MFDHLPQIPCDAWLYVAIDIGHPARAKFGVTLGETYTRTGTQTANPGMMPVVHLPVPAAEAHNIERFLHTKISLPAEPHRSKGNPSEWYLCKPQELLASIVPYYVNCMQDLFHYYNDDVPNQLYKLAVFPTVGHGFFMALAECSGDDVDKFIDAYNGVRVCLGAPPATEDELFGPRLHFGQTCR